MVGIKIYFLCGYQCSIAYCSFLGYEPAFLYSALWCFHHKLSNPMSPLPPYSLLYSTNRKPWRETTSLRLTVLLPIRKVWLQLWPFNTTMAFSWVVIVPVSSYFYTPRTCLIVPHCASLCPFREISPIHLLPFLLRSGSLLGDLSSKLLGSNNHRLFLWDC